MEDKVNINSTEKILRDLDDHIRKRKPFSIIRFGDALFGIVSSFFCPGLIDSGKWNGRKGIKKSNTILGQLTIPTSIRRKMVKRVIHATNNANYCDSYDAYKFLNTKKGLGIIGREWKTIHECVGITNENYCSCFVHYFSIVMGEYNLFDLMRGRKIFCITSRGEVIEKLKLKSGAKAINFYRIPRRGRRARHYKDHYKKVVNLIRNNAKKYDLFLIGAGFLGKLYCDEVKRCGGRAFDAGRLFDFWSGTRRIDSRPKRFIKMSLKTLLCKRIKKHPSGVW